MNGIESITYKRIQDIEDIHEVVLLQAEIWSPETVSPLPQLVASIHNGGIIIGAFFEDKLIGFCYGFAGFKNGESYLISHMAGILPDFQNYGVGYQLKLKQREWAIDYGYKKIVWTYDPLEIRNGYFNLCKLGAYSRQYISSYYGEMNDKLNKGLTTDRLLIEWDICSNRVDKAIQGVSLNKTNNEYSSLLTWEKNGEFASSPSLSKKYISYQQDGYIVPVPSNIQLLKQKRPELAQSWRYAIRKVLSEALLNSYVITGVHKEMNSLTHFYILENKKGEALDD